MLLLFSGPFGAGVGRSLAARGVPCVEYDMAHGGAAHDVRDDEVFRALLLRCRAGEFRCAVIAIPCNTFTVLRLRPGGPPQLRGRGAVRAYGVGGLALRHFLQVSQANLLVRRSVLVAQAVGSFIFEHPADMGDPESTRYSDAWADHAPLWMLDEVRQLREETHARMVTGDQCMCGGRFRKPTSWLASPDVAPALAHLDGLECTHGVGAHPELVGVGEDGVYRSREAAAYPEGVCEAMAVAAAGAGGVWQAFEGVTFATGAGALHVGSARPHASDGDRAELQVAGAPRTASLRAVEPETSEALEAEPLPVENQPPRTDWVEAPAAAAVVPGPFTTEQLIPAETLRVLEKFRHDVAVVFSAARKGRWQWARDHRPRAVELTEEQALHPRARGWTWERREGDVWHAIQPSAWPESPPGADLEVARIIEAAKEGGFDDMEIIAFIAHGYPAPEGVERCAVLAPPHVGALKECEAFEKCARKDRERGWVRHSGTLPHVWPLRVDPQNIVLRFGKARMTTDKSMRQGSSQSYNECVDLTVWAAIEYVRVARLGRGVMVLSTARVPVKAWGFDLEAFFRKTAKARQSWWLSGLLHRDGFGLDIRVQFGQREAPVLTGRQSCFIVWAIRRELRRLDAAYAPRDPLVLAWVARRAERMAAAGGTEAEWTALFVVMIFVDDGGAASMDDLVFDARGEPVWIEEAGERVQQRRAHLHCEAALGVVRYFGHRESEGKTTWPGLELGYLGVTLDLRLSRMYLTLEKRDRYGAEALALLAGADCGAAGVVIVQFESLNSLVHKLLHASSAVVLGRQHMYHLLRARRRSGGLRACSRALGVAAQVELRWWVERLSEQIGIPLASRTVFPAASSDGVVTTYADASRELSRLSESGYGGWAVFGDTLFYVEGRWERWELEEFSINVLELAAHFITTFAMLDVAVQLQSRGDARAVGVASHSLQFTDNTAAEHSSERGRPHERRMQMLIARGYGELLARGVYSHTERVASVDNDIADGLSRGGTHLVGALQMARGAGLRTERASAVSSWRDLGWLRERV